jgi:hypothetical protein
MRTTNQHRSARPAEDRVFWFDEEMAELSLLLPGRQAAALERLANSRGLTLGRLIRLLIGDCLARQEIPEIRTTPRGESY